MTSRHILRIRPGVPTTATDATPLTGEYWRVCAEPDPSLGVFLEVWKKSDGLDLISGEELYDVYLTSDHDLGTMLVKKSWLREKRP